MKKLNLIGIVCFVAALISCNQQESNSTSREKNSGIDRNLNRDIKGSQDLADAKSDGSNKVTVKENISDTDKLGKEKNNPSDDKENEQQQEFQNLDKYRNWMQLTFSEKQNKKLRDIIIPGTHNSGTFRISPTSNFANGSEKSHFIIDIINSIPLLNGFVDGQIKDIFYNWSKTQNKSIRDQLKDGIRFLDLRVAPSKQSGSLMIVHGQESIELSQGLTEIADFVKVNPKEIVFLKSSISYDYSVSASESDKSDAQENMLWMIGKYLNDYAYTQNMRDASISDMWSSSKSIILLHNDDLVNAWGQVKSNQHEKLLQNIDSFLATGLPDKFVEICLCLTPEGDDVIRYIAERYKVDGLVDFIGGAIDFFDGIFLTDVNEVALNKFQSGLHSRLTSSLNQWQQKKHRMNILSIDFYDEVNFVDRVIQMNKAR